MAKALQSDEAIRAGWKLAKRAEVLPEWHRRGRPEEFAGDQSLLDFVPTR